MSAAAALAAANEQKDMGWIRTGKVARVPKLDDPLQLFSLVEVVRSDGVGAEAMLTVKVVETCYDDPVDFLPQGGGCALGEELQVKRKDVMPANPPSQDMVADLASLNNLNEGALLHTVGMRYCGGDKSANKVTSWYCTFIGSICVATNPFAPQNAWKNTFNIEDYIAAKPDVISCKKLQPHPWAVADMAYRELLNENKNQAVLICGESGAGKTECCKFVLEYLIRKKESTVERLAEKMMATNDPLEAFGNAKTVNNDNSSRFAKCMQICLDAEGRVIGAEIQTSLLEKARSCAFFQQERNFHIFYMLCYYRHVQCSSDPGEDQDTDTADARELLGELAYKHLLPAEEFAFIRPGDTEVDTTGVRYRERFAARDIDWFKRVIGAFRSSLGFAKKETDDMMAVLTAILHLGNVSFTENDDGASSVEAGKSRQHLEVASECLGLEVAAVEAEIVKERIMMGGSLIAKDLNKAKAMSSRDAFCKATFHAVFSDIVTRCNASVGGQKEQAKGKVGVLDIFGFERMQFNSLEQICINYTNEKLHQTFINEVFETEKRIYRDEGLDPGNINFTDNAMVLEMISGSNPHDTSGKSKASKQDIAKKVKRSLFGVLDDVCKQDKNTGVQYCEQASKIWKGAKDENGLLFGAPKFGAEEFTVYHFAGPVKYGTTEVDKVQFLPPSQWAKAKVPDGCPVIDSFVTKNKDKVPQSLLDFFAGKAKNTYYLHCAAAAVAEAEAAAAAAAESSPARTSSSPRGGGGGGKKTIVSKFNREIEMFFQQLLTGAAPKFIRTINPRPKGIPAPATMGERFNLQRVLGQLRYTGILDTVRVRASGFIIRKKYEDFAPSYIHPCNLLPEGNALQGGVGDSEFAERVRAEPELAKEVCRLLLRNPEYAVPDGEVLEGKTMVFIKRLTTIALLEKKKEDLMAEVIHILQAKVNIVALSLRWLRHGKQVRLEKAARKLQASWRVWMRIYGPEAPKGKWLNLINLYKTYGDALPIASAWALGRLARVQFGPTKQRAIRQGQYKAAGPGGGLVRRRSSRRGTAALQQPPHGAAPQPRGGLVGAEAGEGGVFANVSPGGRLLGVANGSGGIHHTRLLPALAEAAAQAARACPRSQDEAVCTMPTRRYIAAVHRQMVTALKVLDEARPGPHKLQDFLLTALRDPAAVPSLEESDRAPMTDRGRGDCLGYMHANGGFAVLKPALYAADKHRPEDLSEYLACFVATALDSSRR